MYAWTKNEKHDENSDSDGGTCSGSDAVYAEVLHCCEGNNEKRWGRINTNKSK